METITYRFWRAEDGQDLVEYTLLLVLIIIVGAIVMRTTGSAVTPVWQTGNATVENAAVAAS